MKQILSTILFILFHFSMRAQLSEGLIDLSVKVDYKEIISLADSIDKMPEDEKKNDALLSLSYAYLNEFKFVEVDKTISHIQHPSLYQEGAIHELRGIKFMALQIYKKASMEFQEALRYYSRLQEHTPYYETCNNLASALQMTGQTNEANIITDKVIDYAVQEKDSTLLISAYINKFILYPEESSSLLNILQHFKASPFKRTILYQLSKTSGFTIGTLNLKNEMVSIHYNIPIPLQFNETEDIRLSLIDPLLSRKPDLAIKELHSLMADSAFLPLGLRNRIHSKLSLAYREKGVNDSSAYHLLKIVRTGEQSDSLRDDIPVALANISKEDKMKDVYLILLIVSFMATVLLVIKWILGTKKLI